LYYNLYEEKVMEILITAIGILGSTIGIHNFYEDYVVGEKRIFESARSPREEDKLPKITFTEKKNNTIIAKVTPSKPQVKVEVETIKEEKTLNKLKIKVDTFDYLYYNKIGYKKQQIGNYQEAVKNYNKSIELHPVNPVAYYNLGVIYEENKIPHKAIIAYYGAGLSFNFDEEKKEDIWQIYRIIDNIATNNGIDADKELDALANLGNKESS